VTKRDNHLRSADFFDADHHPSIVFTASRVERDGPGVAEVSGELALRGVTEPLGFSARITGGGADTPADTAVTLTATVMIDRTAYGMTWNRMGMMPGRTKVAVTARFTHA
jgi:polyisoprenoid-binding protein YceI